MALALRLLLLLLLAVALPARAAQAAPMRARGADEGAGKASPAAWLHEDLQPLESPAGVSAGRAFPAPFLVDARKTSSHRRGPPRGRNKPRGVKMSLEKSKHRDQMLSGLERRRGGCTSLSLLLSLSSRGLSLHICTRRARHRGRHPSQPRGPAAAFTPCRAVSQPGLAAAPPRPLQEGIWHQLTGCPNCTTGHAPPEIPCNFPVSG
ncbi:uncharacterized protein LOC116455532 isoform X1 [Corvus moneduloides]|uniref:uncharacterized protein LOC116455532 isoform X1 n=1 Tax=Corvus moneduloides TaxID=1196302 RepID=UPI001363E21F|nr:uncharacterized protein LOC116455532 isoform X1 [Corvus moneduloides]